MTGGLGEIPEPTVKVRMRENQQVAYVHLVRWCLALSTPKFDTYFGKGVDDAQSIKCRDGDATRL